jgi:ABC-type multidrug transport system fused ATPase/permease subunit
LLSYFDYIYVLKGGRVAEEGTFDQLKSSGAIFQELLRHQQDKAMAVR